MSTRERVRVGLGVYRRAFLAAPPPRRVRRWLIALLAPLSVAPLLLPRAIPRVDVVPAPVRTLPPLAEAVEGPPVEPLRDVIDLARDHNGWVGVTRDGDVYQWGARADAGQRLTARRRAVRSREVTGALGVADGFNEYCRRAGSPLNVTVLTRDGIVGWSDDQRRAFPFGDHVTAFDARGALWITRDASGDVTTGTSCEPREFYYGHLAGPPPTAVRFDADAEIFAGEGLGCVRGRDGRVDCWAFRASVPDGGVGDARDVIDRRFGPSRIPVPPLSAVTLDADRGCGVSEDRRVWCWSAEGLPHLRWQVWLHPWLRDATALHPFDSHSLCATLADRRVVCDNRWRAFSAGSREPARSELPGLRGAVQIVGSYRTEGCARIDDGTVRCWGAGYLPDGGASASDTPSRVTVPEPLRTIEAGQSHACGLGRSGAVWCWGGFTRPTPVPRLSGVTQVVVGDSVDCAIGCDAAVWCWCTRAANAYGDGDSVSGLAFTPQPTRVQVDAVQLSAGAGHVCALGHDGVVRCWGELRTAWPGHPRILGAIAPLDVALPTPATAIFSVGEHACARLRDGRRVCWGGATAANASGETDARETFDLFAAGPGDPITGPLARLDCAVGRDRTLRCGQLCDPRDTVVPHGVAHGAVAESVTVAATTADRVCVGTLGRRVQCHALSSRVDEACTPPSTVMLPRAPRALTVGDGFACALTDDGAAWCWGDDREGQLGDAVLGSASIEAPALVVR